MGIAAGGTGAAAAKVGAGRVCNVLERVSLFCAGQYKVAALQPEFWAETCCVTGVDSRNMGMQSAAIAKICFRIFFMETRQIYQLARRMSGL